MRIRSSFLSGLAISTGLHGCKGCKKNINTDHPVEPTDRFPQTAFNKLKADLELLNAKAQQQAQTLVGLEKAAESAREGVDFRNLMQLFKNQKDAFDGIDSELRSLLDFKLKKGHRDDLLKKRARKDYKTKGKSKRADRKAYRAESGKIEDEAIDGARFLFQRAEKEASIAERIRLGRRAKAARLEAERRGEAVGEVEEAAARMFRDAEIRAARHAYRAERSRLVDEAVEDAAKMLKDADAQYELLEEERALLQAVAKMFKDAAAEADEARIVEALGAAARMFEKAEEQAAMNNAQIEALIAAANMFDEAENMYNLSEDEKLLFGAIAKMFEDAVADAKTKEEEARVDEALAAAARMFAKAERQAALSDAQIDALLGAADLFERAEKEASIAERIRVGRRAKAARLEAERRGEAVGEVEEAAARMFRDAEIRAARHAYRAERSRLVDEAVGGAAKMLKDADAQYELLEDERALLRAVAKMFEDAAAEAEEARIRDALGAAARMFEKAEEQAAMNNAQIEALIAAANMFDEAEIMYNLSEDEKLLFGAIAKMFADAEADAEAKEQEARVDEAFSAAARMFAKAERQAALSDAQIDALIMAAEMFDRAEEEHRDAEERKRRDAENNELAQVFDRLMLLGADDAETLRKLLHNRLKAIDRQMIRESHEPFSDDVALLVNDMIRKADKDAEIADRKRRGQDLHEQRALDKAAQSANSDNALMTAGTFLKQVEDYQKHQADLKAAARELKTLEENTRERLNALHALLKEKAVLQAQLARNRALRQARADKRAAKEDFLGGLSEAPFSYVAKMFEDAVTEAKEAKHRETLTAIAEMFRKAEEDFEADENLVAAANMFSEALKRYDEREEALAALEGVADLFKTSDLNAEEVLGAAREFDLHPEEDERRKEQILAEVAQHRSAFEKGKRLSKATRAEISRRLERNPDSVMAESGQLFTVDESDETEDDEDDEFDSGGEDDEESSSSGSDSDDSHAAKKLAAIIQARRAEEAQRQALNHVSSESDEKIAKPHAFLHAMLAKRQAEMQNPSLSAKGKVVTQPGDEERTAEEHREDKPQLSLAELMQKRQREGPKPPQERRDPSAHREDEHILAPPQNRISPLAALLPKRGTDDNDDGRSIFNLKPVSQGDAEKPKPPRELKGMEAMMAELKKKKPVQEEDPEARARADRISAEMRAKKQAQEEAEAAERLRKKTPEELAAKREAERIAREAEAKQNELTGALKARLLARRQAVWTGIEGDEEDEEDEEEDDDLSIDELPPARTAAKAQPKANEEKAKKEVTSGPSLQSVLSGASNNMIYSGKFYGSSASDEGSSSDSEDW
jgi:hypothetical protein